MALAVVLVGGGVGAAVLDTGADGEDPPPSERPTDGREVVSSTTTVPSREVDGSFEPIGRPPVAYALTYRVEGFAVDGAIIDIEERAVRLPWASRVSSAAAEEPGSTTFLQIADLGVLQTGTAASLASEPAIAPGSAHVTPEVAEDVLEWRHEVRTILERDCQVVRAAGPIDVAEVAAPEEGASDWADLCVDGDGLVLQEEWVIGGDVFRRRTATALEVGDGSIPRDAFVATAERPEGVPGGSFVELTSDSRAPGVRHWELASPPDGFRHVGRYGFSPPRADDDQSVMQIPRVAVIVDVYEDGDGGAVVVANGGTADQSSLFEVGGEDADDVVDLGELGEGEVLVGLRQREVRTAFERGRFLRVYGTLEVDELIQLARTLVPNDEPGAVTAAE